MFLINKSDVNKRKSFQINKTILQILTLMLLVSVTLFINSNIIKGEQ